MDTPILLLSVTATAAPALPLLPGGALAAGALGGAFEILNPAEVWTVPLAITLELVLFQDMIIQKHQKLWMVGVTPQLLKTELSQEPPCQVFIFVPQKLAKISF